VVETALVVDVATKYSCNCTKNCIFTVWTLKCRLLAWQFNADARLPVEYTTTTNSSLQYDNGQNAENRMLVFYSPEFGKISLVWLPRNWIFILKCSAKVSSASYA
jgi:hypothetical protein